MEKIIVVLYKNEHNPRLIELMQGLFPECEIHTVPVNGDSMEMDANNSARGDPEADGGRGVDEEERRC